MNIKSGFALLIAGTILSVVSCKQKEVKKEGKITGKFLHAPKTLVYLERFTDQGEQILDSAMTDADGNFEITNRATDKVYYGLRTDPQNLIFLLTTGNENIEVTGDAKDIDTTYTVKGSEDSELIRELKKHDRHFSDSLNKIYAAIRSEMPEKADSAGMSLQKYYTVKMEAFAKEFISQHPKSLVSLSATKYLDQQRDIPIFENLHTVLSAEYPGNQYVKDFESIISNLKKLPVGSMAPDIRLNSPDGKQVALSSFKGKIVLIDFWASWCGPCRKENPRVTELYRKYKNKNFEIFGVSLDEDVNAWKEAIKKDRLVWPQGSDLKKWDSEVVHAYQVEAIPFTVLVNKEGKIIAKGLSGEELDQKIMEAL